MIILALDIGDVWTGSAISDPLGITATPYQTVKTIQLEDFLHKTIAKEKLEHIVVGYPKTLKGTESDQTKKIVAHKELLEKKFPDIE
jgi:putative pre-16S rRNA nuclease